MKNTFLILCLMVLYSCGKKSAVTTVIPAHFEQVDQVLWVVNDLTSTMSHWASLEAGKPGSGRYEYVDLENAGGLTMELLWSHP